MANLSLEYTFEDPQSKTITGHTVHDDGISVTYDNVGDIGVEAHGSIDTNYILSNQVVNSDNSIDVDISGNIKWVTTPTADQGFDVTTTFSLGNTQLYQKVGKANDSNNQTIQIPSTHFHIPASQNSGETMMVHFLNVGVVTNDEVYIGLIATNPNPPRYIPGRGKKNGVKCNKNAKRGKCSFVGFASNIQRNGTKSDCGL